MDELVEILVAEDDPANVELLAHVLDHDRGSDAVHFVPDGEAALDFIFCRGHYESRSPEHPPKLVLLDMALPKLDGLRVLQEIKRNPKTQAIPVVIFTSSNSDKNVAQCYRLGANSYVEKPADFGEFQERVKEVCRYWLQVNEPPPALDFLRKVEMR
jgi:two-component system, response regulator